MWFITLPPAVGPSTPERLPGEEFNNLTRALDPGLNQPGLQEDDCLPGRADCPVFLQLLSQESRGSPHSTAWS